MQLHRPDVLARCGKVADLLLPDQIAPADHAFLDDNSIPANNL